MFNLSGLLGFALIFRVLTCLFLLKIIYPSDLKAQSRPTFGKKHINPTGSQNSIQNNTALNSSIDEIMDDTNVYDPRTLWQMNSLTDITQPFWDPYDVDLERNDRAVTKAATIVGGRHLSQLIKGSELQSTFDYLKRSLADVRAIFNYSIKSDGDRTYLSKDKKGKKLLELSMDFNLSQGLDPSIRLGENFRFRYDYVNQRPFMEYGFNF